ncbi:MAG: asparagine synthase (glutamine-hydrolyzing) [Phycisphaerales bacterium]|nr:asparagine synthase (glutamine-hydrolyzing) [Phycisphaerales bacterium]
MCGIAVLFGEHLTDPADRVRRMLHAQAHRGPDGVGIALCDGDGQWRPSYAANVDSLSVAQRDVSAAALGHNWLAIQDTSESARQPMIAGTLGLVFNGEIYNFIELRLELEAQGTVFRSKSDTEVLLELWKRDGPDCVHMLRGMFAFVIIDTARRTLWAVRDPFGIKPVYWAEHGASLMITSEIRALHAAGVPRRLRETSVLASVAAAVNKFGPTETFYEDVHALPPGTILKASPTGIEIRSYYELPDPIGDLDGDVAIHDLRAEVEASVQLHLRSSRRIATCLSGGLDSTNLAWLIGENLDLAGQEFSTFTMCSAEAPDSEIGLAALVAEKAKLPHHVFECSDTIDPFDVLEMAVAYEEPNHAIGPINQYLLLRHITASGATVVLDGQGGDELLSGYTWYWPVLIRELARRGLDVDRLTRLRAERLPFKPELAAMFDRRFHDLDDWVDAVSGGVGFLGVPTDEIKALPEVRYYLFGGGDWRLFRQREYFRAEMQYLLRQEDRLGMWFGLECRVPYVDRVLIDYVSRLSPELLIRDGYLKYPFRVMIPHVPDEVRWTTRKRGFWNTDQSKYRWLRPLARKLAFESPMLRRLFPALEAGFDELNFNQCWRLAQVGLLERCGDRAGLAQLQPELEFILGKR